MGPSDLLPALSRNTTTLHTMINRLEQRGYVEKNPHPTASRGVLVTTTDEGQQIFDELFPAMYRNLGRSKLTTRQKG